jgi:hypothetical protein
MMEIAMSVLAAPGNPTRTRANAAEREPGFLRRVFNAVMRSRARRADEDIARRLHHSDWRLTDEMEREMMRQLTRSWNLRP